MGDKSLSVRLMRLAEIARQVGNTGGNYIDWNATQELKSGAQDIEAAALLAVQLEMAVDKKRG